MQEVNDNIYFVVFVGMLGTFLLAFAVVFFYLVYQRKLDRQQQLIQEAQLQHQKELLYNTIGSQEEERSRIGRDLHDDVGGALAGLRLGIERMTRHGNDPVLLKESSQACNAMIDTIIGNVRNISHSLSPPGLELFGLADTIEELCGNLSRSSDLRITFENRAADLPERFGSTVILSLYRVIQELISNTLKHAGAAYIWIQMRKEDTTLIIEYTDDGKGFDMTNVSKKGMGLQNIESRLEMIHAVYTITSQVNGGFKIKISVMASTENPVA